MVSDTSMPPSSSSELTFDASVVGLRIDEVSVVIVGDHPVVIPLAPEMAGEVGFNIVEVDDAELLRIGVLPRLGSVEAAPAAVSLDESSVVSNDEPAVGAGHDRVGADHDIGIRPIDESPLAAMLREQNPSAPIGFAAEESTLGRRTTVDVDLTAVPEAPHLAVEPVAAPSMSSAPAPALLPDLADLASGEGIVAPTDSVSALGLDRDGEVREVARPYALGDIARPIGVAATDLPSWPDVERRLNDRSESSAGDDVGVLSGFMDESDVPADLAFGFPGPTPTPALHEFGQHESAQNEADRHEAGPDAVERDAVAPDSVEQEAAEPDLELASHPFGADAFDTDPFGDDLLGADPSGADAFGDDLLGADPFGADAFGDDLLGADPSGAGMFGTDPHDAARGDAAMGRAEQTNELSTAAGELPVLWPPSERQTSVPTAGVVDSASDDASPATAPSYDADPSELAIAAADAAAVGLHGGGARTADSDPTADAPSPDGSPTVASVVLRARGVRRRLANFEVWIDHLDVAAGEILVVRGAERDGKTALGRLLAGWDAPDEGELLVAGVDHAAMSFDERTIRSGASLVMAQTCPTLVAELNVVENVELALLVQDEEPLTARRAALAELNDLGISHLAERPASTLARSEAIRVGVARTLIGDPAIVVADDVTVGLDSTSVSDVLYRLLVAAHAGTSVVVTTTDPRVWHALVTERGARGAMLERGRFSLVPS